MLLEIIRSFAAVLLFPPGRAAIAEYMAGAEYVLAPKAFDTAQSTEALAKNAVGAVADSDIYRKSKQEMVQESFLKCWSVVGEQIALSIEEHVIQKQFNELGAMLLESEVLILYHTVSYCIILYSYCTMLYSYYTGAGHPAGHAGARLRRRVLASGAVRQAQPDRAHPRLRTPR
jgi:hypothetical protein